MRYQKVLIVSDNERMLNFLIDYLKSTPKLGENRSFKFVCSAKNDSLAGKLIGNYIIEPSDVKREYKDILKKHDLVISAHCKQLFPPQLTTGCKCINIHPGLNPYNRGWYPQVFSILNGLPLGATIHEIDVKIDHGPIIVQKEVPVYAWDTSLEAYDRVQDAEEELVREYFADILNGNYTVSKPSKTGNLNLQKDFKALREIKLDQTVTYKEVINKLRALTHGNFKNAYFIDSNTGKKVYISLNIEPEE